MRSFIVNFILGFTFGYLVVGFALTTAKTASHNVYVYQLEGEIV